MINIVNENDIKILQSKDEIFTKIYSIYGPPPNWIRPKGFITLSRIILEQQVSLESAKAHFLKLNNYLQSFTPKEILKLSDAEMRNCQISRQKASYLRALSSAVLNKEINLSSLSKLTTPEIRQQLKSIKGIGNWTADIYLIFCMQVKDIFPTGDVAVITTIKELINCKTREEIDFLTESWKPYRSLAAFFLWHYYLSKRKRTVIY
jgi:DNA-3-methyladenine glycosylase II